MPTITRPSLPTLAALMIFLVILGGFIPAIFDNTQGTEVESFHQEEGQAVILKAPLEATVITVDQNPGRVNVSLIDTETGDLAVTGELDEGDEIDLTIRGNTVTVRYVEAINNNEAVIRYEYPIFYEWDNTTIAFVGVIAVIILVLFLYMIFILIEPEENT